MRRLLLDTIDKLGGTECIAQVDLFFPEDFVDLGTRRLAVATAKAICASCPVQKLCLDTALADDLNYGIWGGHTADERAILRRRLKSAGIT